MVLLRISSLLAVALVLLASIDLRTADDVQTRDVTQQLEYSFPELGKALPEESRIVRVDAKPGSLALVIRAPFYWEGVYAGISRNLRSIDMGQSWMVYRENIPSLTMDQSLMQAPSSPKILYKNLDDIRLFLRTEDNGETWKMPRFEVEGISKEELALRIGGSKSYIAQFVLAAIHSHDPLTLYASISVFPWGSNFWGSDLPQYDLPGLYISHDGGDTWSKFAEELRNGAPLGISPVKPLLMFGHAKQGVVKSTDGGEHWRLVGQAELLERRPLGHSFIKGFVKGLEVDQFVLDPSDENIVYIVSNKGIYRSLHGGDTWVLLNLGFDIIDGITSMALNPLNPNEVFAGTILGTFYSKDRGLHWQKIYPPQSDGPQ